MKCPKCGHRLYVLASAESPDAEEVWRRYRCSKCKETHYTTEFVIEPNQRLKRGFNRARHARERKNHES